MRPIALAAMIAAGLASTPAKAQTAPPETYSCAITVNYAPSAGTAEVYQHDFSLTAGAGYQDDRSTATREHRLNVSSIVRPARVEITANYFSDVSALSSVNTVMTLRMRKVGRAVEIANGFHRQYHSATGSYTVSYTLRCRRDVTPTP